MTSWTEITEAVGLTLSGDREKGGAALADAWAGTADEDHAQRCVLAHYLADVQPVLADEVRWDEIALDEHRHLADDDLAPIEIPSARGLLPSLHLNLGDGYLRQGLIDDARAHLARGQEHASARADDGYGAMVRRGLSALEQRLAESR